MPKKYFVTRHRGAIKWAADGGARARKILQDSFDPSIVCPGDIVIGTLPVHLVAEINRRGCHYWHLTMEVPSDWRGKELDAEQMRAFGARLQEFRVADMGVRVSDHPELAPDEVVERTHLCIATEQMLANALPLKALPWRHLIVYASQKMRDRAKSLVALVEQGCFAAAGQVGGQTCEVVNLPDDVTWPSLAEFAGRQAQRLAARGALDFNLTGGTKPMSMAFAEAFRSRARLLYCATESGSLHIVDALSQDAIPLRPDLLDLRSYMAMQGWSVRRSLKGSTPDPLPRIRKRGALTARLVLRSQELMNTAWTLEGREAVLTENKRDLLKGSTHDEASRASTLLGGLHAVASAAVKRHKEKGQWVTKFKPWVLFTDVDEDSAWSVCLRALQEHGLIANLKFRREDSGYRWVEFRFTDERSAAYVAGGYLEEYALLALEGLGLPPGHIDAGVGVGPAHRTRARSSDELNELDAVAVWRNRLLVIECKAGTQLKGAESQAIVHKLDQLKKNVGGVMGTAWLVSLRALDETKDADVLQRADLNGIRVIDGAKKLRKLCDELAKALGTEAASPWPGRELVDALPSFKPAASRSSAGIAKTARADHTHAKAGLAAELDHLRQLEPRQQATSGGTIVDAAE